LSQRLTNVVNEVGIAVGTSSVADRKLIMQAPTDAIPNIQLIDSVIKTSTATQTPAIINN